MKKFILATLAIVLGFVSLSSFAEECLTSDTNFCTCYVQNFKKSCPQYLPSAMCLNMNAASIKEEISQAGVGLSCAKQHDTSPSVCKTTTNYFLNHC